MERKLIKGTVSNSSLVIETISRREFCSSIIIMISWEPAIHIWVFGDVVFSSSNNNEF